MNFYLQKAKPKTVYNQQIVISQFLFVLYSKFLMKKVSMKTTYVFIDGCMDKKNT